MPIPVITAAEMKEVERWTSSQLSISESSMIDMAGEKVFGVLRDIYSKRQINKENPCVFVCGKGHNGADGLSAALLAKEEGFIPRVFQIFSETGYSSETEALQEKWKTNGSAIHFIKRISDLKLEGGAALIVDGLLGAGVTRPAEKLMADCIQWINLQNIPILSIDIPSGLYTDSNEEDMSVKATWTLSLGSYKLSSFFEPARSQFGKVLFNPLCFPEDKRASMTSQLKAFFYNDATRYFPRRPWNAHKYSTGKVLVIAGSMGMYGAAVLSAKAAMRTGAGMVRLAVPAGIFSHVTPHLLESIIFPIGKESDQHFNEGHIPSLKSHLEWADAVVLGPGLSKEKGVLEFLKACLPLIEKPVVVDGDGLQYFAKDRFLERGALRTIKNRGMVLTPHEGEFSRMLEKDISLAELKLLSRIDLLKETSNYLNTSILLKGPTSLFSNPEGEALVLEPGSPALATAGTGDVLAGILGAILCHLPIAEAAGVSVFLHSRSGLLAAQRKSIAGTLASDVLEALPFVLLELEKG